MLTTGRTDEVVLVVEMRCRKESKPSPIALGHLLRGHRFVRHVDSDLAREASGLVRAATRL